MKMSSLMVLVFLLCTCATFGCPEFYSFANGDGKLYKWDPTTNGDQLVWDLSADNLQISSLAINLNGDLNTLIGYDNTSAGLVSINIATGAFAYASPPCAQGFPGLTYCKGDNKLYGIDPNVDKLYEITDIGTCSLREIGLLGVDFDNTDLTCQLTTDLLYTFNSKDGYLYTLDKGTGHATPVGIGTGIISLGVGMSFDPADSTKLYLFTGDNSYSVNPITGQATLIGALQHPGRISLTARLVLHMPI